MRKLKDAGVRVIPGGDYGFVWCPHGEYAKDIELFVTDMGFTPMEAIVAATKHGSELLRMETETRHGRGGQVRRPARRRRRPARRTSPILQDRSKLEHGDEGRQGHGQLLGLPQELHHMPDFIMDIEHIQRAAAVPPTMPTAAEVQH